MILTMRKNELLLSMLLLLILSGCKSDEDPFAYELPMYGGTREPIKEKRESLSEDAVKEGWEFFAKNDYNNAMKHFNEGWYYNPESPQAFLGIGTVLQAEARQEKDLEKLATAVKILEKANKLDELNPQIMNSLGKAFTEKAVSLEDKNEKDRLLGEADNLFKNSCRITPKGQYYYNWAVCLYHLEKYQDSWAKMVKANELNFKIPAEFLTELRAKINQNTQQ